MYRLIKVQDVMITLIVNSYHYLSNIQLDHVRLHCYFLAHNSLSDLEWV